MAKQQTEAQNPAEDTVVLPPENKVPEEVVAEIAETGFQTGVEESAEGRMFDENDVKRIRQQEKDKLYKRVEDSDNRVKEMEAQLTTITEEREAAKKEAAERADAENAAIKRREEEEMTAKELLSRRDEEWSTKIKEADKEWKARFSAIEEARATESAMVEKERAIHDLNAFTQRAMQESEDFIIPELRDFVSGTSEEEVQNSIAVLRERSSAILEAVRQSAQSGVRGTPVTAPPVGPMDMQTEQQQLSAEQIRDMPMNEYMQMRDRLLKARPNGRF